MVRRRARAKMTCCAGWRPHVDSAWSLRSGVRRGDPHEDEAPSDEQGRDGDERDYDERRRQATVKDRAAQYEAQRNTDDYDESGPAGAQWCTVQSPHGRGDRISDEEWCGHGHRSDDGRPLVVAAAADDREREDQHNVDEGWDEAAHTVP